MVLELVPLPEALHEQDTVNLKESMLYSGPGLGARKRSAVEGTTDAMQELQAAENRLFWITTSERTPEKRPNYKGNFGGQSATMIVAPHIK